MRLPENVIEELIPEGYPTIEIFTEQVLQNSQQILNSSLSRSYQWAEAILQRFIYNVGPMRDVGDNNDVIRMPLRASNFSAGFIYINPQIIEQNLSRINELGIRINNSFSFGGYLLVHTSETEAVQRLGYITVQNRNFPIIINYGFFIPHGAPTNPLGGTGCCWIKNASPTLKWTHGILVSRHVVSTYKLGSSISFTPSLSHSNPKTGTLADIDACTIDAAIVSIDPIYWSSTLMPLTISSTVAPGTKGVNFNGQYSSGTGTVLRIYRDPTYVGNMFGHRIITDCYGLSGDSGTLLKDSSNNAVGVYMGTIPDGHGGDEGIFQSMEQVKNYFKLELYY